MGGGRGGGGAGCGGGAVLGLVGCGGDLSGVGFLCLDQ